MQIQTLGDLFGNRLVLFDKGGNFLGANLCQFHQTIQPGLGIVRQPQADIFADGLDGIEWLIRQVVSPFGTSGSTHCDAHSSEGMRLRAVEMLRLGIVRGRARLLAGSAKERILIPVF